MGSGAVAFWALTTLVLLASAVLTVVVNYVAHKEYTEEIDRLRRDLLASRERNGVYIAFENYNEMTRQLELNRQEINEKIQLVKVLEKEKADKEDLCQELRLSLEETQVELMESKNTLKLATETVKEQLDKEKQLLEQAHSILAVADTSTDKHMLHDKLDRKRSTDEEYSRISQDFRSEFHKKITKMQENIADFLKGHVSSLNEMKKTLDQSVQKRNEDLSALSDDLAALVNIQTTTLQGWSKKLSEEISAAQQNTQNLLQDARRTADAETNAVHNFLTDVFLPLSQNLQHHILRSKAENDGFTRLVMEQGQRNIETFTTFITVELEALSQFRKSFNIPLQKVEEVTEHIQRYHNERKNVNEKNSEELVSSLRKIAELVRNTETQHLEIRTEEKYFAAKLDDDLELVQQNIDRANLVVSASLDTREKLSQELHTSIKLHGEETSEIVKEFLDRAATVTSGLEECNGEVETAVRRIVSNTETAWSKQYSLFEQHLRQMSENHRKFEKQTQDLNQLIIGNLYKSAHAHESHVEEQQMAYACFIRDCVLSLEQQCAHTSDWHYNIDSHVQERGEDVEQFLVELLHQDVHTGTTPQRKQLTYPTTLVGLTPTRMMENLQKIHEASLFKDEPDQVIVEDVEADSADHFISNIIMENGIKTPSNLHKVWGNEDVNKENSRPGDDKETNKFLKSESLNNMKVKSPLKPLKAKN